VQYLDANIATEEMIDPTIQVVQLSILIERHRYDSKIPLLTCLHMQQPRAL
jgi:hypothetical protein